MVQKNVRRVQMIIRNLWKLSLEIRLKHNEIRPSYSVFCKYFWKGPYWNVTSFFKPIYCVPLLYPVWPKVLVLPLRAVHILAFSCLSLPWPSTQPYSHPLLTAPSITPRPTFSFSHPVPQSWEEILPKISIQLAYFLASKLSFNIFFCCRAYEEQ